MNKIASLELARKESVAEPFFSYSHHVTDTVISTKDGNYLSIFKLDGRSHQAASQDDVFQWVKELNNSLRSFCNQHVSIWSHVVRRKVNDYPESNYDNYFCKKLDENYQETFSEKKLMVNDLYFTVVYRTTVDTVLSMFSKLDKGTAEQRATKQKINIGNIEKINRSVASTFKKYGGSQLGVYDEGGFSFSSAFEFLTFLYSGERKKVPVLRKKFSEYLAPNRVFFSTWGESLERKRFGDSQFGVMIEVSEYVSETEPGHFNHLLESEYEFVLTQSFSCLSKHAALQYMKKHHQNLIDSGDASRTQIDQLEEAMDQLVSGKFVMGDHHATFLVVGDSNKEALRNASDAQERFANVGVIASPVDLALEAGFFAQFPANWKYRPRPSMITSLNFLSFSSFHNYMSGKPNQNPWGASVTILKTVAGTPLYFSFHSSKSGENSLGKRVLGNTTMLGKSGTGKTVLLGFLLAQSEKFAPTVVAFDKDRGMELTIRAMGGSYLPLKMGKSAGFNPLQMEPTPENIMFLRDLVRKMVASGTEVINHEDEMQIEQALKTVMLELPRPLRRLSTLLENLPNPETFSGDHPSVHSRLLRWCGDGEYGWLFDNEKDTLDLSVNRLWGFDVTEFLEHPLIRSPLMMYLIHRTESMINGNPFMYVIDEFWKALQDEYFEKLAHNKQKTIRKENGLMIMCSQEPADALNSPIGKTLVQQCATLILLPNPQADKADYVDGLKLTEAEFEVVRNLDEESRSFLIKQGSNSAVATLDLSDLQDELLILSGTPERAELAEKLIDEVGAEPKVWIPQFLKMIKEDVESE